jgi:hypothetical protein
MSSGHSESKNQDSGFVTFPNPRFTMLREDLPKKSKPKKALSLQSSTITEPETTSF